MKLQALAGALALGARIGHARSTRRTPRRPDRRVDPRGDPRLGRRHELPRRRRPSTRWKSDLSDKLDFVLATAADPGQQVTDIEDMVATRNIDALVVLPFEIRAADRPGRARQGSGQVGDGRRPRPSARRASRTSTSPATIPASAAWRASTSSETLPEGGKIVVLRGIPTTIDNERVEAFEAAHRGLGHRGRSAWSTATGTATTPST